MHRSRNIVALLVVATAVFADAPTLSFRYAPGPATPQAVPAERQTFIRRLRATFRAALQGLRPKPSPAVKPACRKPLSGATTGPWLGRVLPFSLLCLPPPARLA